MLSIASVLPFFFRFGYYIELKDLQTIWTDVLGTKAIARDII